MRSLRRPVIAFIGIAHGDSKKIKVSWGLIIFIKFVIWNLFTGFFNAYQSNVVERHE